MVKGRAYKEFEGIQEWQVGDRWLFCVPHILTAEIAEDGDVVAEENQNARDRRAGLASLALSLHVVPTALYLLFFGGLLGFRPYGTSRLFFIPSRVSRESFQLSKGTPACLP